MFSALVQIELGTGAGSIISMIGVRIGASYPNHHFASLLRSPTAHSQSLSAQGRFTLALEPKNLFISSENLVQLQDKDASSHGRLNRTTELRALGIGTLVGEITMGNPGEDSELVPRSS